MSSASAIRAFTSTSWDELNTTDVEDVQLQYYPRIEVLKDIIASGEQIKQSNINEIYDIAKTLLKHRHSYTDWSYSAFGNTAGDSDQNSSLWTDYPVQIKSLVELGSPVMTGTIFEKWFLCPDAFNVRTLTSAPMIFTRQYKLPAETGFSYDARSGLNMPDNIQKTNLGAIFEFFIDTSETINTTQQLNINSSGQTLVYIDGDEHSTVSNTPTAISFKPRDKMTSIIVHWVEGDSSIYNRSYQVYHPAVRWPWGTGHRNAIRYPAYYETVYENYTQEKLPGYIEIKLNNKIIPSATIFGLTPQSSLNTKVTDARVTSIYTLYQIVRLLCNHGHLYYDNSDSYDNNYNSATSTVEYLESVNKVKNLQISYDAGRQGVYVQGA